ncbi:hypothetical protein SZN_14631 [Streptomyces zinciresistens K42]|uniref:Uncharacterized protein n=1 Tax=Streptomyces zinciresistens K42 TaxID=700597 RepID=G2GBQ2_9ACTN|nr:hypothetical protein [Streptomyces zinciresistens]EGX59075.1 hypothetical protein SZN_14631 [Streptomyces zinciresistens K42]
MAPEHRSFAPQFTRRRLLTAAAYRGCLYLPNARSTTPPAPETTYEVLSVPA